jgi:hypothetical protein
MSPAAFRPSLVARRLQPAHRDVTLAATERWPFGGALRSVDLNDDAPRRHRPVARCMSPAAFRPSLVARRLQPAHRDVTLAATERWPFGGALHSVHLNDDAPRRHRPVARCMSPAAFRPSLVARRLQPAHRDVTLAATERWPFGGALHSVDLNDDAPECETLLLSQCH